MHSRSVVGTRKPVITTMPFPPGTLLGRYKIRSALGAGGMGEVYLAEDTELERLVAFKVLPVSLNFQRRSVAAVAATVVRLD